MAHKLIFGVLATASICLASCNSEEKKVETSAPPVNTTPVVENTIGNSLTQVESEFAQDSSNFDIRLKLAANYYAAGILNKAAYHFMKVYEHDNKNLIALTSLGNVYYDSKQDDKAIEFYEKALVLDPNNIDMRCDLATNYMNVNRLKKAIEILRENIKINPVHGKSHHNLAVILKKNGDIKEADAEMKEFERLEAASK